MNWMENCSFVGHNIFMKMWWECVNVFDNHFLAHFIWKFPPPKINSEGSVLVTVMSSVLVYLGLFSTKCICCGKATGSGDQKWKPGCWESAKVLKMFSRNILFPSRYGFLMENLPTPEWDEKEGIECLGHLNWIICSPSSPSSSQYFPTFPQLY